MSRLKILIFSISTILFTNVNYSNYTDDCVQFLNHKQRQEVVGGVRFAHLNTNNGSGSHNPNKSYESDNLTNFTNLINRLDDYENMKCTKKLKSFDASLKDYPINEVIAEVGKTFIGTPYIAGTLDENPNAEEVVVKITGLDCVTFVENCLVFAMLIKQGKTSFDDYRAELELIRYRGGKNTGYSSRLHYFTDWIYDNEQKGIIKNISQEIGGVPYQKQIDFMTTHRDSYKQLASDDLYLSQMSDVESQLNSREEYFIPKEDIASVYDKLQTGDIIGITSTIDGLDVAHTGYVYKQDGKTYLMHASLKNKEVEISSVEIQDYLMNNPKQSGIIVARVLDVNQK